MSKKPDSSNQQKDRILHEEEPFITRLLRRYFWLSPILLEKLVPQNNLRHPKLTLNPPRLQTAVPSALSIVVNVPLIV